MNQEDIYESTDTNCFHNISNTELLGLVQDFFTLIKNMLVLNVTDKLDAYFERFEGILQKKNLNWQKFLYVKKIFEFRKLIKNQQDTKQDLFDMIDFIYREQNLCIHDHKMIILFFESFGSEEYIENLVLYLDENYQEILEVYIEELFLQHFYEKYHQNIHMLYERIQNHNYFRIENYPFIHYLNSKNILKIQKDLYFHFYQRYRYEMFRNPEFKHIFVKYISKERLNKFYIRFSLLYSIIFRIRKNVHSGQVIENFKKVVFEILPKTKTILQSSSFLYEVLLLVYCLDMSRFTFEISSSIKNILDIIELNLLPENLFHVSIVYSLIGNVLFKNLEFDIAMSYKKKAFDLMKNVTENFSKFPNYFSPIQSKEHYYSIVSSMAVTQFQTGNYQYANSFVLKLEQDQFVQDNYPIELRFYQFLRAMSKQRHDKAATILKKVEMDLSLNKLERLEYTAYRATLENLKLILLELVGTQEVIVHQRKKSRKSVDQLYHEIVKEDIPNKQF